MKIAITEKLSDWAVGRLREVGEVLSLEQSDEESVLRAVGDCDALVVRTYTNVTRNVIEAATKLKVIGRAGVGVENIDLEAARERNIQVVYTPDASTESVADLIVGMMICLVRGIHRGPGFVCSGSFFEGRRELLGRELSDLTLGIIGFGRIGRALGRRASWGFQMRVLFNDIVEPSYVNFVASSRSKKELLAEADVVSLSVPLTFETRNLISEAELMSMKRGAFLINTARGGVVDSLALAKALESGQLGGAALDVFDPEPLPLGHPLLTAPNTLFTPHIGARTEGAQERMNAVVEDVIRVLRRQRPNFPAWE